MQTKNKMEFSKKIILVAGAINILVVLFTLVIVWRTCDTSPLCYLIPSVAAEVSAGTSWYYSKAKKENEINLRQRYGDEMIDRTNGGIV